MEFEPLTALDEETFRRVWNRVMPDQSLSPVVVRECESSVQPTVPVEGYIGQLEEIMDGVRQWQSRLEGLSRQSGGKTALRSLWEGEQRQLRRLDGLYFLLTGGRYRPRMGKSWGGERRVASLRRGFFLEMDWVKCYQQLSAQLPQTGLKEAVAELEQGALEQGRQLRVLLERTLPQGDGGRREG